MTSRDERFQRLLDQARDDPAVIGVALTGSRGKGFGGAHSDYDVLVLLHPEADDTRRRWYEAQAGEGIDLWTSSPGDLARRAAAWGSEFAWAICWNERYSYANVAVPLDKTGELRRLVDAMGVIPAELRQPLLREALDAYVNSFYRSLKCLRNGNRLGARLEAADAIGYALTFIFALDGRHRPYFGYLARELAAHPLQTFPLTGDDLLAMIEAIVAEDGAAPQQRLFAVIDAVARRAGCADVLASWGEDYAWMRAFQTT